MRVDAVTFCGGGGWILPPIGLISTDNISAETLFIHLSVVSSSRIYGGIRNCLVVKRKGQYLVCLVHVEHRGEMGWRPRRLESEMYD